MVKNSNQQAVFGIFGLGKTGLSAARYFSRTGESFWAFDTRDNIADLDTIKQLTGCLGVIAGRISPNDLLPVTCLLVSPGIDPRIDLIQQAVKSGIEVIGDVELFVRRTNQKIVAITGSNGKSTVTDLTHQLLRAAGQNAKIGGNFGVPVLDHLPEDDADYYVLELSSFQLDTLSSLSADVATILNISQDHLDRYHSFADYCRSKQRIYQRAKACLVNADDSLTWPENEIKYADFSTTSQDATYHLAPEAGRQALVCNGHMVAKTSELQVTGTHNMGNLLAALGLVDQLQISINESVINTLKAYRGLPHRFQLIARDETTDWVDDSKATNVGATQAALLSVDKTQYSRLILIAGGDAKGSDLSPLTEPFANQVDQLILLGKDASKLAALADKTKIIQVTSMQQAVSTARRYVAESVPENERAMVLLSPACASLDMYSSFVARGLDYQQVVEASR